MPTKSLLLTIIVCISLQGIPSYIWGQSPAAGDEALDNLLEKLGEKKDEPPPKEEQKPEKNSVGENNKDLDQHLEELTGRKKKKEQAENSSSDKPSPLEGEMRDIQERLRGKDTGEETRSKQKQIISQIDNLIAQQQQGQSQGKGKSSGQTKGKKQAGQIKGQGQGSAPSPEGEGTSPAKADKPKPNDVKSILADKSAWGHLPPQLRGEMGNAAGEEPLPASAELVKKYYKAILLKSERK